MFNIYNQTCEIYEFFRGVSANPFSRSAILKLTRGKGAWTVASLSFLHISLLLFTIFFSGTVGGMITVETAFRRLTHCAVLFSGIFPIAVLLLLGFGPDKDTLVQWSLTQFRQNEILFGVLTPVILFLILHLASYLSIGLLILLQAPSFYSLLELLQFQVIFIAASFLAFSVSITGWLRIGRRYRLLLVVWFLVWALIYGFAYWNLDNRISHMLRWKWYDTQFKEEYIRLIVNTLFLFFCIPVVYSSFTFAGIAMFRELFPWAFRSRFLTLESSVSKEPRISPTEYVLPLLAFLSVSVFVLLYFQELLDQRASINRGATTNMVFSVVILLQVLCTPWMFHYIDVRQKINLDSMYPFGKWKKSIPVICVGAIALSVTGFFESTLSSFQSLLSQDMLLFFGALLVQFASIILILAFMVKSKWHAVSCALLFSVFGLCGLYLLRLHVLSPPFSFNDSWLIEHGHNLMILIWITFLIFYLWPALEAAHRFRNGQTQESGLGDHPVP